MKALSYKIYNFIWAIQNIIRESQKLIQAIKEISIFFISLIAVVLSPTKGYISEALFRRTYLESTESAQVGAVFDVNISCTRTAARSVRVLRRFSNPWQHLPRFILYLSSTMLFPSYFARLKSSRKSSV